MDNYEIISAFELCRRIAAFPNTRPEVVGVMQNAVLRGECPHAVRVSLKAEPITMYRVPLAAAPSEELKP